MTAYTRNGVLYVEVRTEGCTCVLIDRSVWSWTWNTSECPLHDPRLTTLKTGPQISRLQT